MGNIAELLYIVYSLSGIVLILTICIIHQYIKMNRMLRGDSRSIEDSICTISKELDNLHGFRKELEPYLSSVELRLKRSFQGHHTLRFNPFRGDGSGGSQSFATAFLTEEGNGLILSSLNSRDRMSVYSKIIRNFKSELELTEEENEALQKAKESCTM